MRKYEFYMLHKFNMKANVYSNARKIQKRDIVRVENFSITDKASADAGKVVKPRKGLKAMAMAISFSDVILRDVLANLFHELIR